MYSPSSDAKASSMTRIASPIAGSLSTGNLLSVSEALAS